MLLRVDIDVDHLFFKKTDPNHIQFVIFGHENKSSNGTQHRFAQTS